MTYHAWTNGMKLASGIVFYDPRADFVFSVCMASERIGLDAGSSPA